MTKIKFYKIRIKVHPAVYRYIDNHFPVIKGVYNLTKSPYYCFLSSMLCRSCAKLPSLVYKRYDRYVPIETYITEFDFYHYGWTMSEMQQCLLSKTMLQLIMQEACHEIAVMHVVGGVPRNRAICNYIDENLYEDNEISYSYLTKYYQRKYKSKEVELKDNLKRLTEGNNEDFDT